MWKKYFNQKSVEIHWSSTLNSSWSNFKWGFFFIFFLFYELPYAVSNGHVSEYCQIELGSNYLLWLYTGG